MTDIKHRITGAVLATHDGDERATLVAAVATRANLTGANLTGAYLTDAHLADANLEGANLTGANLTGANLTGANLARADLADAHLEDVELEGANLEGAHLTGADLTGADLAGADLTGADLAGADLTGAYLTDAHLTGADLTGAKEDFRAVLDASPNEVTALLRALCEGRIDGSHYEGECSCLKGTIANARGCSYMALSSDYAAPLYPDSSRPSERLFMAISPGHTPEINPVAAIVYDWILEWQAERGEGDMLADEAAP